MIHRQRGERPQKSNPHRLTRNQHVIPAATLRRFAGEDGRVEVHFRDGRTARLLISNQLFCVDRLWDQQAEAGFTKSIEDNFLALISSLEKGRSNSLEQEEHMAVTRFRSLWKWRNYFIDFPMQSQHLNGIAEEDFTTDQKEFFESQHLSFIEDAGMISSRVLTGFILQTRVDQDTHLRRHQRWGLFRTLVPQLIIPDRPAFSEIVPATPSLLLVAGTDDGELAISELRKVNLVAMYFSRDFVVVPAQQSLCK